MNPSVLPIALALPLMALLLAGAPVLAQTSSDGMRFDVQSFRPSGAPQDVVTVQQSRPLSHLSFSLGMVVDFALDPLVLVQTDSQSKYLSVVGNRLQLDGVATIGLFDWIELGLSVPMVLSQTSDNLEALGTEGSIRSTVPGDVRLTGKVAVPGLRRAADGSGFGAAVTFGLSFPTGMQDAFASDGAMTMSPGLVLDYRFKNGLLLTLNGGYWDRPVGEFNGLKLGPMATFCAATEIPLVRSWGITAVGALFGSASTVQELGQNRSVPAEAMLGLRWYSSTGVTLTVGGGGGCGCAFSAPTFRFFASVIWVPSITKEAEALERFKNPPPPPPPPVDPDGDGVIGERDKCPEVTGPVENGGCPDEDKDKDGIADRVDRCPAKYSPRGRGRGDGCPLAEVDGDQIIISDQVYFAFNKDVILDESYPVLDEVARIIQENPDFARIRIEGHTDSVATQQYNLDLSRRRSSSVERYLVEKGVEPKRLRAQGFGMLRPIADNSSEEGRQLNRRVEFHIEKAQAARNQKPAVNVTVQGNRIVTDQPLRFAQSGAELLPESLRLLEGVARLIRNDEVIDRVRIEVRPDTHGMDLARQRAATVERFLIEQGVERKRIRAVAVSPNMQAATQAQGLGMVEAAAGTGTGTVVTAVGEAELLQFVITPRTDKSLDPMGKNPSQAQPVPVKK